MMTYIFLQYNQKCEGSGFQNIVKAGLMCMYSKLLSFTTVTFFPANIFSSVMLNPSS